MSSVDLRIICIGNLLHGNDGVGHAVFKRLSALDLPTGVELIDGGIGGLTLLPFCKDVNRLLIIDMVKSDEPDGSVRLLKNVLQDLPVEADSRGEHGGNLSTLLTMLPIYLDSIPQVDLLCISASSAKHFDNGLDKHVKNAIEHACTQVKHYIYAD